MGPRAKHINIKYHHFRQAVAKGMVTIEYIDTHMQLADIGTKSLEPKAFEQLRKLLIGCTKTNVSDILTKMHTGPERKRLANLVMFVPKCLADAKREIKALCVRYDLRPE